MNILTVSQLNTYVKALIDGSAPLRKIYISGEISNFTYYYRTGHMYLTLKDEKSQLKAVMFASYAERLRFEPQNGMKVICLGRVSVYEKSGEYQLYIEDMQPEGLGALYLAYNQLKDKLEREGLFDSELKKPLPKFPKKIGVATSNTGAAVEDIKNITARRYPLAEVVIVPTIVQGEYAPADIVRSLKILDSMGDIDVIILGRGGGSAEDLWAFNDEKVARAVFECKTPIVSAVGHETDTTICDFVADLRAPTPSAAAEIICPDIREMISDVAQLKERLSDQINYIVDKELQRVCDLASSPVLENYEAVIDGYSDNISVLTQRLVDSTLRCYEGKAHRFGVLAEKLNALSPLAVLARGYSVAQSGGEIIKNISQIKENDDLTLVLQDGKAECTVREVIKNG